VQISTQSGSAEVPAKVTTDIRPGVVSMPHGWGRKLFHPEVQTDVELQGVSDNLLTDDAELDSLTGMPIYNAIPCSVRDAEPRPGLAEYDFDRSELLEVPGDWNSQDPKLLYYEGTLWYQTRFQLEEHPGVRRFVHFGAANYHAMVWLDGEPLGEHEGGFTPFAFELPGAGAAGEHVLTVKVDNTRRREAVPTVSTDWWNYGGLTREVSLLEVPETFVREYTVGLDGDGRVRAQVVLDGPRRRQTVQLRIPEAGLEVSGETDDDGRAQLVAEAQLERWNRAGEPRVVYPTIMSNRFKTLHRQGASSELESILIVVGESQSESQTGACQYHHQRSDQTK
jgi:hypothetical protein